MKLAELLHKGQETLLAAGVDEYKNDAIELLLYILHEDRAYYLLNQMNQADSELETAYEELIKARAERIPLQHITHYQNFMGLDFFVNEHVLTPRFDTEILVDTVLKAIPKMQKESLSVLDMCTGSGCIAISIDKLAGKDVNVTGVDISEKALEVAKRNVKDLDSKVCLVESDLFSNISGQYDIIVSNPPYIRSSDILDLMPEVREHEPILALDGSEDGLDFYKRIIEAAPHFQGSGSALFFEIGYDQGEDVCRLMKAAGYINIELIKDFAGLDRVVWGMTQ